MTITAASPQPSTSHGAANSKLTAADRSLFQGTAAAVHPWQSNAEILASIGCNFHVIRTPAEHSGRSYPDCQLWLRDDNQDLLGFFGSKRQIIQPATFIDAFRSFCDASSKAITLDVVGSYNNGRSLYMAAKLNGNNSALLDSTIGSGYGSGGGMAISRAGHSAYIPTKDRTDHWLILSESFGEALRPRVSVIASELICSNSLARRITECEIKLSHAQTMNSSIVHAVLEHAIRQCSAYDRIKERLICTPISMDNARSTLRRFFDDQGGSSRIVQRLEQIYTHDLIGSELDTRRGNAWRLASAVTQYTSHERIRNRDVAFRSQLEGSRARTANRFLHFLEEQLIDRTTLLQG